MYVYKITVSYEDGSNSGLSKINWPAQPLIAYARRVVDVVVALGGAVLESEDCRLSSTTLLLSHHKWAIAIVQTSVSS